MKGKIWMDGRLVEFEDAKVHVLAHGFHYGTGVFEGIRVYHTPQGRNIFRLRDHMVRFLNSAKVLQMIDFILCSCALVVGSGFLSYALLSLDVDQKATL